MVNDFVLATNNSRKLIDFFQRKGIDQKYIYACDGIVAIAKEHFRFETLSEDVYTAMAEILAKQLQIQVSVVKDCYLTLEKPPGRNLNLHALSIEASLELKEKKVLHPGNLHSELKEQPEREKTFYELPENYIFAEYCFKPLRQKGTTKTFSAWKPCVIRKSKQYKHLPTVAEIKKRYRRNELFFSQFRFADSTEIFQRDKSEANEKAHRMYKYGDFILESDNPQAVEFSRKVITFLENTLCIPPEAISLDCSGGRSIHIGVSPEVFDVKPSPNLPEQYEELARIISDITNTIFDLKIYKSRRMFRAYGSYRSDKKTYKVSITKEELFTLSMEEILTLAKTPRPMRPRKAAGVVPEAKTLFEQAKKQAAKRLKARLENLQNAPEIDVSKLQGQRPPCILYLLEHGCSEGMHYYENLHASYCHAVGMSIDEAFQEIAAWQTTCPYDKSPAERRKRLRPNIKNIYETNFKFLCVYARQLKLPCEQTCPLYSREKLQEIKANENKKTGLTLEKAREEILKTLNDNLKTRKSNKNILVKSPPGTGKSTIAIDFYTQKHRANRKNIFILAEARIDHLEELQSRGELPSDSWQIVRGRTQIKSAYNPEERKGNCFKASEINELYKKRAFHFIPNICKLGCSHVRECQSNPDMYLGQWETGKNLAMTHEMLLLGGSNIKKSTRIIIDEIPLSAFLEKIIVEEHDIHHAVIDIQRRYKRETYFYIFKALYSLIDELKTKRQNKVLNGSDFLKCFEFALCKLTPPGHGLDLIHSIKPSDIWESKDFFWRQDFCAVLKSEILDWKKHGDNYNSNIYLKYHEKHQNIEFYFLRKRTLKAKTLGIVALDGTTDKIIWQRLLDSDVQEKGIDVNLPVGTEVIQVHSGRYGKTYHKKNRTIIQKEQTIIDMLKSKSFFGGWHVAKESLSFPTGSFGHFYGTRGTNRFEDYQMACIFGTPNIQPDDFREIVKVFFAGAEPLDFQIEKKQVRYGANINGKDYTVKIPVAKDYRVQAFWEIFRESEIYQIAHRVRPLLSPKTIYLITSLPIPGLPPTKLLSLNDLCCLLQMNNSPVTENSSIECSGGKVRQQEHKKTQVCCRTPEIAKPQTNQNTTSESAALRKKLSEQIWFFEKWKCLVRYLEEALQQAEVSHVKKLYKIIYIYKTLIQKFYMGQTQTTQGGNAVANLPSRREAQYYHFKQFTSSLGLTSEKYSINIENSPPLNLTVHFKSEYQGEVLPKAVVEAEYKKFLRLKEKGRLSSFLPLDLGEVD